MKLVSSLSVMKSQKKNAEQSNRKQLNQTTQPGRRPLKFSHKFSGKQLKTKRLMQQRKEAKKKEKEAFMCQVVRVEVKMVFHRKGLLSGQFAGN